MTSAAVTTLPRPASEADPIASLEALERRALWLSTWMIHNANHLRPNRDGLKVGGHQASCASSVTLLAALYGHAVRPEDRVAVKPHAGPVFHALMYLMGAQSREALERFRGFGGVQSYPSRTKDTAPVDFSTGSVGLGVGVTLFASLVQDYLQTHGLLGRAPGRMIALMGDAELDEGNIFEALLEGWKHEVRNLWWIIDYNRQSLDGVVADQLFQKIQSFFATVGWNVVTLKYGKLLRAAFAEPGGDSLQRWIDDCPNDLYSALTFEGGAGFRRALEASHGTDLGIQRVLAAHDDASLHRLMTNLGGHDMAAIVEAFDEAAKTDRPTCFVAYTVKGWGLPFAGHKDNHSGLMNEAQMEAFRNSQGIVPGEEWEPFAGLDAAGCRAAAWLHRAGPLPPAAHRDAQARPGAAHAAPLAAGRRDHVDAGGFRPADAGSGQIRQCARRARGHHLARRHRLDQPRRLGQSGRALRPYAPFRRLQGPQAALGPEMGALAGGPAYRARHRREQSVPAAGRAWPGRAAVRPAAAARGHGL